MMHQMLMLIRRNGLAAVIIVMIEMIVTTIVGIVATEAIAITASVIAATAKSAKFKFLKMTSCFQLAVFSIF